MDDVEVDDFMYLPLTSEDGRPVGLVSSRDIIRFITDETGACIGTAPRRD